MAFLGAVWLATFGCPKTKPCSRGSETFTRSQLDSCILSRSHQPSQFQKNRKKHDPNQTRFFHLPKLLYFWDETSEYWTIQKITSKKLLPTSSQRCRQQGRDFDSSDRTLVSLATGIEVPWQPWHPGEGGKPAHCAFGLSSRFPVLSSYCRYQIWSVIISWFLMTFW